MVSMLFLEGISTAQVPTARDHLMQFPKLGLTKSQRLGEVAIWMAVLWRIWKVRNMSVFENANVADMDMAHSVELFQVKVWQWLRAKIKGFIYTWVEWQQNPYVCLRLRLD
ncbi:uncharacterized protein LOC130715085 [Lotus japonicus]|uniref:uncharacterized protein LOC130715085 n=1 Tax=Lotus japonicus TaxID=34305 RepID=UPI002582B08C|nr:uncharacterized protein LOC130715085 [Lotus japonicus]